MKRKYKYVYTVPSGYIIQKVIGGRSTYFGVYQSAEEAHRRALLLAEHNWDKRYAKMQRGSYNGSDGRYRYIRRIEHTGGVSYVIKKWIDGRLENYGTFRSLEDAIEERDLLVRCDWDDELACIYQYYNGEVVV